MPAIQRHVAGQHPLETELFRGPRTARGAVSGRAGGIVEIRGERVGQELGSAGLDEAARQSVPNQLDVSSDAGGDHGQSGGHGLENGVGYALPDRREDEDVQSAQDEGDVVPLAEEPDAVFEPEVANRRLELRARGAVAGDDERVAPLVGPGKGAEKSDLILDRVESADGAGY